MDIYSALFVIALFVSVGMWFFFGEKILNRIGVNTDDMWVFGSDDRK